MAFSKTLSFIILSLTYFDLVSTQLSSCPQPAFTYKPPHILPGFLLTKIADGFAHPRQIIVDRDNNLILSSLGDGIVGLKVSYDGTGCPSVTQKKILVPDSGQNFTHSVVLSEDGRTLFASTPSFAYAYEYDANSMAVGEPKTIVKGMFISPKSLSITRAMAIPRQYPNLLMVFRGEDNDTDYSVLQPSSGRAMIKLFQWKQAPNGGFDFASQGEIFARGVRDTLQFDEDHNGNFWNVDNGADEIMRVGVPLGGPGSPNPADEINLLGKVCPGRPIEDVPNIGFPYCHGVWNSSALPENSAGLQIGQTFSSAPDIESDAKCNQATIAPRVSIVPHSAPLGIRFYNPRKPALGDYLTNSAFVTYHGPTGHKVVLVPFKRGDAAAPPSSPTGIDFIWTDPSVNLTNCKSEMNKGPTATLCLSPVGLAYDSQGALFITSDQTGEVFAVTKDRSRN